MPVSYINEKKPPITEISEETFHSTIEKEFIPLLKDVANNAKTYGEFASKKAQRGLNTFADINHNKRYLAGYEKQERDSMRFFSYNLDGKSVGLVASCRPTTSRHPYSYAIQMSLKEKHEQYKQVDPEEIDLNNHPLSNHDLHSIGIPNAIEKILELASPGVENAGDILTEHLLRNSGDKGVIISLPNSPEAEDRSAKLGAFEDGDGCVILNPLRRPDIWKKNDAGEWQRADKKEKYLQNT